MPKISELSGGTPVAPVSGDVFPAARGGGNQGISYDLLAEAIMKTLYPVGAIYTSTLSDNPHDLLGFGTWAAFGEGRVMIGHKAADTDFDTAEETGGAKTSSALLAHTHGVTDPGHNHTQNAHTHVQDSHNHTQDAHTHTQNAHTHTQDAHSHVEQAQGGTTASSTGTHLMTSTATGGSLRDAGQSTKTTVATNQNATAVNQNATATNQAATAVNQNATATNIANTTGVSVNSAGSGTEFSILPPYIVVFAWKRTA